MKIGAYIWCALSFVSLAVYATTGITWWAPLTPGKEGELRFALLWLLHISGPISVFVVRDRI